MIKSKSLNRQALGRGLSSLIPTVNLDEEGKTNEIHQVDSNAIRPNPFQPRTEFNTEEIQGLADSIKAQGLLQPIVVRKSGSSYEIISGERRFRAMKLLAYDKMPCIVKAQATDREMLELALVENIQRENLNDIETAIAYQKLLTECGFSHEELSQRVGKSRSVITNSLRLLKLPQDIQDMVRNGKLSMGHARALLSLEDEQKQRDLAQRILTESLTVRDVEAETQSAKGKEKSAPQPVAKKEKEFSDPDLDHVIDRLRVTFGTDVNVKVDEKYKGSVSISVYSRDDLNRILDIIYKN
jgi:ParB family chromosome partitioning protein